MSIKNNLIELPNGVKLFAYIMLMVVLGLVFSGLGLLLCLLLFTDLGGSQSNEVIQNLMAQRNTQIILQIFTSFGAFVLPAFLYSFWFQNKPLQFLRLRRKPNFKFVLYTIPLFLLANFALDLLVKLSHQIPFEEMNSAFIQNLLATEKSSAVLIQGFLHFSSFGEFLLVFIMMALLPGLGEELSFRGVIYPLLNKISGKKYIAIGISAFAFALIHLQLHNFLAIFFMGCLLGYIYILTQNLWIPILAHIFNNGIIVVMTYLNHLGIVHYDFAKTQDMPTIVSIFGLGIFLLYLFWYKKQAEKQTNTLYE